MMSMAQSSLALPAYQRPLFRGYALVAFTCAWLVGDFLAGQPSFELALPTLWLALAGSGLSLAIIAAFTLRRWMLTVPARRVARAGLMLGALLLWLGLGAARAAWSNPAHDPHNIARYADGSKVEVTGLVVDEPDERDGYRLLTVDVRTINFGPSSITLSTSGRIQATVYGPNDWFAPTYGDTVTLSGALKPATTGAAPTSVTARMPSARVTITGRGGGWAPLAALFQLRVNLARAIERSLPEPEAALLIGIVLGLKSPTLRTRLPLFVNTGTIHLVVPAGLKVSLLAELASRSARRLGPWPQTLAALGAVGAYAALGGGGAAAIRAAIMGFLLALAPALGRVYNVYTALALAALLMTVNEPALIYDAGFQLTTLATFALPLLTPALQRALQRLAGRLGQTALAHTITESLAVTLAAQIATLPVLALTFHVVSIVAPIANLLTVPLLAPLLTLGGLLALVAALGWSLLATALSWVVWPLAWWVNAAIATSASAPFAAFQVANAPAALALVYYAALGAAVIAAAPRLLAAARAAREEQRKRARSALTGRALALLAAVALLASFGASAPALAARPNAQLIFLDAGPGGSALLLRLPNGATTLINGGPSGPQLASALSGRLPFWARTLDVVALTDARPGDARGLDDVASRFAIGHALDAGMRHPTPEYLAYLDAMRRAGAARQLFRAGDTIALGSGATLTALSPPSTLYPPNEGDTAASDDLILQLTTPGLRVLLLGAADTYALDALSGAGEPLAADVVEVALPRGAPLDVSGPLGDVLRLAHPRVIIIDDAPTSTRPTKSIKLVADPWASDADASLATGAQVYRISDTGSLSMSGDASGWAFG